MLDPEGRGLVEARNLQARRYGNHNRCFFLAFSRVVDLKASSAPYNIENAQDVDREHGIKEDLAIDLRLLEVLYPAINYF